MARWVVFVKVGKSILTFRIAMPRSLRSDFAGQIYHALNRGNARNKIFFKDADFEAFERVVQRLEKYPVDLIAYQWMGNHWHMVCLLYTSDAADE